MSESLFRRPSGSNEEPLSVPLEGRTTDRARLDAAVTTLRSNASLFARLSLNERIALADAMQQGVLGAAERSVRAACAAKGITPGTPGEAEEWATGPFAVVRHLRLVREALTAIKTTGNTQVGPVARAADGRLSVRCFPSNAIDGLLFRGVTVDVRMQAGVTDDRLEDSRARFYKRPTHDGQVVLVLGGGNIASIPAMDVVTKLFNEGKVCALKMSPVNAYLGPFIEEAFAEPIVRGFVAVVYGGAEEGAYLTGHPDIDEIHLTGTQETHDTLLWGLIGPERVERLRHKRPLLGKPLTSELGNISPVIVVPGPYSEREFRFQAEDAASSMVMNGSFLCNAARILVLPQEWDGSDRYLRAFKDACANTPLRRAYYPGAHEHWERLTAGRKQMNTLGAGSEDKLPWTFISGLDPADSEEPLFRMEPFCPIVSDVRIGSANPVQFLRKALDFCNNTLWGTLSATIVVHPQSLRHPVVGPIVENTVARLRYGTVVVNGFSGLSFALAAPPWGAYPGSTADDIQSGCGFVHNTAMLEGIEKVVVRCPLTVFPKPGYHLTHRTAHLLLPRMTQMEARASWGRVPGILFHALRC